MSAGTLITKVVLDNPRLVHCGTEDLVTGHVSIKCASEGELFGPLVVRINLHGRAKTKVAKSTGQSRHIYRGRAPLFSSFSTIHNGPFRSDPGAVHLYPFSINFPTGTQCPTKPGYWEDDARFSADLGDPLPPSFYISYAGFAHRFDAFTEYRLDAAVEMKGIKVKIQGLGEDTGPLVLYDQPRTPTTQMAHSPTTFKSHVRLQNEFLLPESDRPKGFRQKTKAIFSSGYYPEYHFDVLVSCNQHIYIGQPIVFEVAIRPNENLCTAPTTPDINLSGLPPVSVQIISHTEVRAERQFFTSPESEGSETKYIAGRPDSTAPFSKASDHTKTITTDPVPSIASTFSTYNIRQRYTMEISFNVYGAQEPTLVKHAFPVIVYPPVAGASRASGAAVASSSSAQPAEPAVALPAYERPPEYHHVLDAEVEEGMQGMSLGKGKAAAAA